VLLHTLAGVAGNIGMNEIYQKALRLSVDFKNHLQAGNQSFEHIHQRQINEIARILETNLDRLNVFLSSLENEQKTKETISDEDINNRLTELKKLINDNDPESITLCKDFIDNYEISSEIEEVLKNVLVDLENFEFENAFNQLKQ
jgi:HPt (histidine-containing phosphotransfer) domain-containing protein